MAGVADGLWSMLSKARTANKSFHKLTGQTISALQNFLQEAEANAFFISITRPYLTDIHYPTCKNGSLNLYFLLMYVILMGKWRLPFLTLPTLVGSY